MVLVFVVVIVVVLVSPQPRYVLYWVIIYLLWVR